MAETFVLKRTEEGKYFLEDGTRILPGRAYDIAEGVVARLRMAQERVFLDVEVQESIDVTATGSYEVLPVTVQSRRCGLLDEAKLREALLQRGWRMQSYIPMASGSIMKGLDCSARRGGSFPSGTGVFVMMLADGELQDVNINLQSDWHSDVQPTLSLPVKTDRACAIQYIRIGRVGAWSVQRVMVWPECTQDMLERLMCEVDKKIGGGNK